MCSTENTIKYSFKSVMDFGFTDEETSNTTISKFRGIGMVLRRSKGLEKFFFITINILNCLNGSDEQ